MAIKNRRIFITGSLGFMRSYLVRRLFNDNQITRSFERDKNHHLRLRGAEAADVLVLLKNHHLEKLFERVYAGPPGFAIQATEERDVKKAKLNIYRMRNLLRDLKVSASECLVVADKLEDITAAFSLGMKAALTMNESYRRIIWVEARPPRECGSPKKLSDLLNFL